MIVMNRKKLAATLTAMKRTMPGGKSDTFPVLANVLFAMEKDTIRISSTDLEVGQTVFVENHLAGESDSTFTLPLKQLAKFLKASRAEMVCLEHNDGGAACEVSVKCDSAVTTMVGVEANEYPTMPPYDEGENWRQINATDLYDAMSLVITAVSTDVTRYNLNGIYFVNDTGSNDLKLVATDGHRLANWIVSDAHIDGLEGSIVPLKFCKAALPLLKKEKGCSVSVTSTSFVLSIGDSFLRCRTIDGQYPNYQQVIPKPKDAPMSCATYIDREELVEVIDAMSSCWSERSCATKWEFHSNVEGNGAGGITITASSEENGSVTRKLPVEVDDVYDGMTVGFNGSYVKTMAKSLKGDLIAICAKTGKSKGGDHEGALAPVVFMSDESDGFGVIMPMRV